MAELFNWCDVFWSEGDFFLALSMTRTRQHCATMRLSSSPTFQFCLARVLGLCAFLLLSKAYFACPSSFLTLYSTVPFLDTCQPLCCGELRTNGPILVCSAGVCSSPLSATSRTAACYNSKCLRGSLSFGYVHVAFPSVCCSISGSVALSLHSVSLNKK